MRRVRRLSVTMLAALALAPAGAAAQDKQPSATGTGGAAATVDALATDAAIAVLRDGGNAVDATVAAAAVLGVTEPYSCGIGGGGFMVIRDGGSGDVTTIDSREKSPSAMLPNSFFINGRPPTGAEFNVNRYSGLSAGVPGTVAGWDRALRRHGTMRLREVLRPAIGVARRGFVVDQTFVDQTTPNVPYFNDIPSTAAVFLDPDGTPRDVGSTLRNPDLARAYRRIARLGARRGFYEGPLATAMVRAATAPPVGPGADHTWRPGLMSEADVRAYHAKTRQPTVVRYRGLDVYGMGPPSSGGSTVGEALNILEGFSPLGTSRAEILHRYIEASRLAFADRGAYLADPSFFDVPLRGLLSDAFAAERRALIGPRAAGATVPAGDPSQEDGSGATTATVTHPGQSTTHVTVADRRGNVVSYTFTIESTGGNGIVVPGYGFLLNNELTDFNIESTTHPNRPERNKRPRSSMAPTIVTRGDRPFLALGSPGGATIITTVLQILVNRIDLREPLPKAIAMPRISQRNSPRSEAEAAFTPTLEGHLLRSLYGHVFTLPSSGEIGAATGIEFRRRGVMIAAAEPTRRGGGAAAVVRP